jgi:hypothetical protein
MGRAQGPGAGRYPSLRADSLRRACTGNVADGRGNPADQVNDLAFHPPSTNPARTRLHARGERPSPADWRARAGGPATGGANAPKPGRCRSQPGGSIAGGHHGPHRQSACVTAGPVDRSTKAVIAPTGRIAALPSMQAAASGWLVCLLAKDLGRRPGLASWPWADGPLGGGAHGWDMADL